MSKDLFFQMREKEIYSEGVYPTKKEVVKGSTKFAEELIDSGDYDISEIYTQALRLKEMFVSIEKRLKEEIEVDGFKAYGVKAEYRNGGYTLDFSKDPIHAELTAKLKDREAILKASDKSKDTIYDSEGIEIEKLPRKERKSSITVSY